MYKSKASKLGLDGIFYILILYFSFKTCMLGNKRSFLEFLKGPTQLLIKDKFTHHFSYLTDIVIAVILLITKSVPDNNLFKP